MIDWKSIAETIENADCILLSTHENPDGDGLGSAAAMYHYLKGAGKDCRMIHVSDLPVEYRFLDKVGLFETYKPELHDDWISKINLALIFDVGDYRRLGTIGEKLAENKIPTFNIDHHPDVGDGYFTRDIINTSAAATGEMIFDFLQTIGAEMSLDICEGLYTAIMTDTGSFRHNNTNVKCHEIAIVCLRAGVKTSRIYQQVYESSSRGRIRLLGKILDSLEFSESGEVAWFTLDRNNLDQAGASMKDVDGFTDFVRTIRGVEVAIMVFENGTDICRLNFRSKGKYVINDIAKSMGGGGHKYAAGAVVKGSLHEVLPRVLAETEASLMRQNGQSR